MLRPANKGSFGESLRAAKKSKSPGPWARRGARGMVRGRMESRAPVTSRARRGDVGLCFIFCLSCLVVRSEESGPLGTERGTGNGEGEDGKQSAGNEQGTAG